MQFSSRNIKLKNENSLQTIIKKKDLSTIKANPDAIIKEAKIMENLRHRNLVHYIIHTIEKNTLYIEMEYCPGGDLSAFMKRLQEQHYLLQPATIYKLSIELLSGLNYLHNANRKIMHRNICPENIYLSYDMSAVIGNFSISKFADNSRMTEFQPSVYKPIEQSTLNYDESVDIFSLGCVFYELITLRPLFKDIMALKQDVNINECIDNVDPQYRKIISNEYIDIIQSMVDKIPTKRPTTSSLLNHPFIKLVKHEQTKLIMLPLFFEKIPHVVSEDTNPFLIRDVVKAPNVPIPEVPMVRFRSDTCEITE